MTLELKIRIIDPKTNLLVEGLGSNSTVFLKLEIHADQGEGVGM